MNLARKMGDLWHQAQAHYAFCLITGLWDAQQPLDHIEHCLRITRQNGNRYWLSQGYVLGGLMLSRMENIEKAQSYTSAYAKAEGKWALSETLVQEAIQLGPHMGIFSLPCEYGMRLCNLYLRRGEIEKAHMYIGDAKSLIDRVQYPATQSHYYSIKSAIAKSQGAFDVAHQLTKQANKYIRTNMNWSLVNYAIMRLAWTLCCVDEFEDAEIHLIQITKQELQRHNPWGLLNTVALLSIYLATTNNLSAPPTYWGLSMHIRFKRYGMNRSSSLDRP